MAFIKFILNAILIFWLIKMLFRVLTPFFLKYLVNKLNNQTQSRHYNYQYKQSQDRSEKGNESYDFPKQNKRKTKADEGEYIDYEEIK